tara:strand:+ start:378 stop:728 length:351 start_codon:yes stop_codon:yes gene_type:complete
MKRNRKENNTDFITDGYNSAKIEETIKEIRNKYDIDKLEKEYLETDTEYKMISEEYKFFKERYPFLFDMTLKPLMDMDRLRYMLNLREDIVNNNITFESASQKVGNDMYKLYHEKK